MATITLNYDASNVQAQKALDFMLSLNLFQKEIDTDKNEYKQLKVAFLNASKYSKAQKIEKYL